MSLTENQTFELHWLNYKHASGRLTEQDRWRRLELQRGRPQVEVDIDAGRTLGGRAASSIEYRELQSKAAASENVVAVTDDVPLVHVDNGGEVKTLIAAVSDTSAGAFITNERASYVPQPRRRLRVLDLVRLSETTVDAVEYARQTTFTNVAAEVAEATSTTTGTKPEATIAFEKRTEPVRTFPHWVPATRRALTDASEMRQAIDDQLIYGARRALEEAVVTAMVADAGATQAKGADALPVAVLKLLTTMRNLDVEPTAAMINPLDYETIRTLSGTSPYLSGPPITVDDGGVERLFAIPLIVTPSVPDDTALIADMQSVSVWMRDLQIYLSTSHASYFTSNLAAILCELRAALAVTATAGVGKVTGWD